MRSCRKLVRNGEVILYDKMDVLVNGVLISKVAWYRGKFVLKTVDRSTYPPKEGESYLLGGSFYETPDEAFAALSMKVDVPSERVDLQVVPYPSIFGTKRFRKFRWTTSTRGTLR